MPRLLGTVNQGRRAAQRAALRMLRRDKQRLLERIASLEIERDEAIAAEQQCRSVVRRLADSGSTRYVRLLQALDDHPEIDAMGSTDEDTIVHVRELITESALARGWEVCETRNGGLEWRRLDESGNVTRMLQHPITPAGGVVVVDVLAATVTG